MIKILSKNIETPELFLMLDKEKPFFVDDERWEKMQSYKSEKDKLRSLASAFLLNKMCEELGIDNPHYEYGEKGKPYLVGWENIAFNLSHSGEYAVLAYEVNDDSSSTTWQQGKEEIGIDIQQIRSMKEGIKNRILSEKEQIPIFFLAEEEVIYLNRIWCVKESYVKMLGVGLALDFRKITVDFAGSRVMAEGYETAYFSEENHLPGYVMSVCCKKNVQVRREEY